MVGRSNDSKKNQYLYIKSFGVYLQEITLYNFTQPRFCKGLGPCNFLACRLQSINNLARK